MTTTSQPASTQLTDEQTSKGDAILAAEFFLSQDYPHRVVIMMLTEFFALTIADAYGVMAVAIPRAQRDDDTRPDRLEAAFTPGMIQRMSPSCTFWDA